MLSFQLLFGGKKLGRSNEKQSAVDPIEEVGTKLRAMMPWISEKALVDKTKN
jgi:ketol-acid reductoisomerase